MESRFSCRDILSSLIFISPCQVSLFPTHPGWARFPLRFGKATGGWAARIRRRATSSSAFAGGLKESFQESTPSRCGPVRLDFACLKFPVVGDSCNSRGQSGASCSAVHSALHPIGDLEFASRCAACPSWRFISSIGLCRRAPGGPSPLSPRKRSSDSRVWYVHPGE